MKKPRRIALRAVKLPAGQRPYTPGRACYAPSFAWRATPSLARFGNASPWRFADFASCLELRPHRRDAHSGRSEHSRRRRGMDTYTLSGSLGRRSARTPRSWRTELDRKPDAPRGAVGTPLIVRGSPVVAHRSGILSGRGPRRPWLGEAHLCQRRANLPAADIGLSRGQQPVSAGQSSATRMELGSPPLPLPTLGR